MNKIRLLLVAFGLLLTIISYAQPPQLTFRFANPRITYLTTLGDVGSGLGVSVNGDYLVFDVQAKAALIGSYLYSGLVYFPVNTSCLSSTSSNWFTSPGPLLAGMYSVNTKFKYGTNFSLIGSNVSFGWNPTESNSNLQTTTTRFNQVTTSYQTLATIYALITNASDVPGIDFNEGQMNNQQTSKNPSSTGTTAYPNPSAYDTKDLTNTYIGRIYSESTPGVGAWTQVGGTTDGAAYTDWTTFVNTSVWDGTPTLSGGSELKASNLRIHSGATLTIPPTGMLTVTGSAKTEINTTNGLIIQSDGTGTGSLITDEVDGPGGTPGTATAVASLYMTGNPTGNYWHLFSSPVVELVSTFLGSNGSVSTKSSNRGMMDYNPGTNTWNNYFTTSVDASAGNIGAGRGFSLRTDANGTVTSTGILQYGTEFVAGLVANDWNCIGNPYSSAVRMNTASDASLNFLSQNANVDQASGVYVWDPTLNGGLGNFVAYSNASGALNLPQGQGFMVKMGGTASLSFLENMQIHTPSFTPIKSAQSIWPTIKLNATINSLQSTAVIAYNSGMTRGLDPTYDALLFKGQSDLLIYTKLVDDNGEPFAIQALPDNNYNGMVIPVGIDSKTGGDVVFSAQTFDLPSSAKVILEDKLLATFTDLSTASYKAVIVPNSAISGRFFLHNSMSTVSALGGQNSGSKLNAYAYQNVEIRIEGMVTSNAIATLYDVTGRAVLIQKLTEGQLNVMPISSFSTGLYLLSVRDGSYSQTFKIILKDR